MSVSLTSRIPAIVAEMQPKAALAVSKAVTDVEAYAKGVVPVDTGNLRASIQGESSGLQGRVNVGADYGIYVEFGTYKMAAQPYLTPAAEFVRPSFEAAMGQIVR